MTAHCDFCGKPFAPPEWNSRTCFACSAKGAPDQARENYDAALKAWNATQESERRAKIERGRKASIARKQPVAAHNRKTGAGMAPRSRRAARGRHNPKDRTRAHAPGDMGA